MSCIRKPTNGIQKNALERLAYEELFIEQVLLHNRKTNRKRISNEKLDLNAEQIIHNFQKNLPFLLTSDQTFAMTEIISDLQKPSPMTRLLQGDVGCGKTLVALGIASGLIEKNMQVALMAPTEVLANQHYAEASKFFPKNKICLLTSSTKLKRKDEIKNRIQNGEYLLVIGTHSLIQDTVKFKSLALSIIDEQHKFGVQQRISLTKKSITQNTLMMTATPIPRSLCLTQFGDLDLTLIKEKPKGRKKNL